MKELAKPSEDIEYVQVLSEELQVNDFEVKNVIANVDFTASYLELPVVREKMVRAALVDSCFRFRGFRAYG